MESGTTWEDPSENLLFELLADIERGDEQLLIIERLADPSGQTYVQVIQSRDGAGSSSGGREFRSLEAALTDRPDATAAGCRSFRARSAPAGPDRSHTRLQVRSRTASDLRLRWWSGRASIP